MKPVWIFNFVKKDSIESFFTTFWNSVQQNSAGQRRDELYYITDGFSDQISDAKILETAKNIVTDIGERPRLIKGWRDQATIQHAKHSELNLVFVGDITNEQTQRNLHVLAAKLREELLDNNRWTTANVRSYALLWRPKSAGVKSVNGKCKAFLNELNSLMRLDINHRPFHKVLFFESSEVAAKKEPVIKSMAIAALHLALHSPAMAQNDLLRGQDNVLFLTAGEAGVFYEKEVQKEQEAYLLSQVLLDKLVNENKNDKEFYDAPLAQEVINKNSILVESLSPESIVSTIKSECPKPYSSRSAYGVDCEVSPLSFKLRQVWNKYYNRYILNLKKDLVNKTKQALFQFSEDYRDKLRSERLSFVNEKIKKIEDFVFEMFRNPGEHKVISLPQCELVLDKLIEKTKDFAKKEITDVAFELPKYLKGAYDHAQSEHNCDEKSVLAVLDGLLRKHPIFVLSVFVRAVILGLMLAYFGVLFFENPLTQLMVGSVLFLAPVGFGLWRFNDHVTRIDALKDQYTACVLMRLQGELNEELVKCVEQAYSDILEYYKWLKEHKIKYLKDNISAISPLEFSFEESTYFKPLVNCSLSRNSVDPKLFIPANTLSRDSIMQGGSQKSGTFDMYELLNNPPIGKVKFEDNSEVSIEDIINDERKNYKSKLLKELLKRQLLVEGNIQQSVRFENETQNNTKLLILDVSGSMSGEKLNDLKTAVRKLEETSRILWIAFNSEVVASGEGCDENFEQIKAGGGTNYIPALQKAAEILKEEGFVDKIIFISDGGPFESLTKILEEAYKLNQPIHTISIGTDGRDVMQQLAEKTSGVQIVVNKIKEIVAEVEDKLNVVFSFGRRGDYTFGELMQKCYVPGCAKILYEYTMERTQTAQYSIERLLSSYSDKNAMREWKLFSQPRCSYQQAINPRDVESTLQFIDGSKCDKTNFDKMLILQDVSEVPDIIATMMSLRPMNSISDLQWSGFDRQDISFSEDLVTNILGGNPKLNIYENTI